MPRLLSILIFLTLALLVWFFLITPRYQDLKNLNLDVQERTGEFQYKEEYFSNIKKISEELKRYEAGLSIVDSAIPPDPSLPSLLNFLEKASSQSGLILKNIDSFSITSSKETAIKVMYLQIIFTGSYPALKNFLSALEKSARFIEVENISFTSPEGGEIFTFNLKIKTHSY